MNKNGPIIIIEDDADDHRVDNRCGRHVGRRYDRSPGHERDRDPRGFYIQTYKLLLFGSK